MKKMPLSLHLNRISIAYRKRPIHFFLGALLTTWITLGTVYPAFGDASNSLFTKDFSVKIITGNSLDDWTAGISYDVNYRKFGLWNIAIGQADAMVEGRLSGTLAIDGDLNRETLISEVILGASLLTGAAGEDPLMPGQDLKKDLGKAADYGSLGYVFAGADLRHETDQKMEEQHLAIGIEAGYINSKDVGIWSFVPSIILAFEWVDPFESEIRDNLFSDNAGFSRFRMETSLKSSIGRQIFKTTPLEPLGLRFDYRYYISNDLEAILESADLDEISYFAASITYMNKNRIGPFKRQMFFVKVADGRLPPATEDETVVSIGVLCPWENPK